MKKHSLKIMLALVLVFVMAASCVLVACNSKKSNTPATPVNPTPDPTPTVVDLDPDYDVHHHSKKAIIYVTALFGGGLYNEETNEPVWDPFYTEFSLYDHWAPESSTIYDFSGVLGEFQEEMGDAFTMIMDALSYEEGTLLYNLSLDEDGNGLNPNVVPANINSNMEKPVDMDGDRLHCYYGAVAIYKQFILETRKQFGDEYDCLMFNQDWRKSPADSAAVLEEFINRLGYEHIIFMSHSMGGPVVNSYLARSQANRDKVDLYLAFAPATLGSFDAYGAMTCPKDYLTAFLTTFGFNLEQMLADGGLVAGVVKNVLDKIGLFFNNNCGMMALCPSFEFLNSEQLGSADSVGGLIVDGKKIGLCEDLNDPEKVEAAKQELYDFYNTLNWALYLDEDGNRIHYEDGDDAGNKGVVRIVNGKTKGSIDCNVVCFEKNGNVTLSDDGFGHPICVNKRGDRIKFGAARLKTYYEGLYVDGDIAMSKVNSYIFLGTGITSTNTGCIMTTNVDENGDPILDANGYPSYTCRLIHDDVAVAGEEGWIGGDGMVCRAASIAGQDEAALAEAGRLIEYPSYWHADVGGAWPLLGEDVLRLMDAVINGTR